MLKNTYNSESSILRNYFAELSVARSIRDTYDLEFSDLFRNSEHGKSGRKEIAFEITQNRSRLHTKIRCRVPLRHAAAFIF